MAYIKGEDAGCEYLEVNEIIEDAQGINWQPPCARKMVTSDLVYSPVQSDWTQMHGAEGSKHLRRYEKKVQRAEGAVPEGCFSFNNEDIGHTQLVTMDVNMGDSPPICQKPYTLSLKHY